MKGYHATVTVTQNTIHDSELYSSAFVLIESSLHMDNWSLSNIYKENYNIIGTTNNGARLFQVSMDSELTVTNTVFQNLGVPVLTSFDSLLNLENVYIYNVETEEQIIDWYANIKTNVRLIYT